MAILFHIYRWCKKEAAKGENLTTGYRYSPKEYLTYVSHFDVWLEDYFRELFIKTKGSAEFFALMRKFYDRCIRFSENDGDNDLDLGFVNEKNSYDKDKITSFFREPGAYFRISKNLHKEIGDCYLYLFCEELGDWLERTALGFLDSDLCEFSEGDKKIAKEALKLTKEKLAIDDKMNMVRFAKYM